MRGEAGRKEVGCSVVSLLRDQHGGSFLFLRFLLLAIAHVPARMIRYCWWMETTLLFVEEDIPLFFGNLVSLRSQAFRGFERYAADSDEQYWLYRLDTVEI